jgi:hypothetical protein
VLSSSPCGTGNPAGRQVGETAGASWRSRRTANRKARPCRAPRCLGPRAGDGFVRERSLGRQPLTPRHPKLTGPVQETVIVAVRGRLASPNGRHRTPPPKALLEKP